MRRTIFIIGLVLCSAVFCGGVWANREALVPVRSPIDLAHLAPVEDLPLAAGRVVAVDGQKDKITIDAAIRRYELPAMTRVFHVDNPCLLTGLTPGDKIRFDVRRERQHVYVVTRIENSN
jgi:Cu/Ag efflux protein CusF